MSFGALFGLGKPVRTKRRAVARDSSDITPPPSNVDPALLALVTKFAKAASIVDPNSFPVPSLIIRNANGYASLFSPDAINTSLQNLALSSPGTGDVIIKNGPSSIDIAVALATGHKLPRTVRSTLSSQVISELQKSFGANIIERQTNSPKKNPFSNSATGTTPDGNVITEAQFKQMVAAAESTPAQTEAQKQIEQAHINELYKEWIKTFGLPDDAKSQKVWKMLVKAGRTDKGGIVNVVPQNFSAQVQAQLAVQDAKNKAAQAASALSMAQASQQSAATVAQLAATSAAMNQALYAAVAKFDALTTGSGSYQQGPSITPSGSDGGGAEYSDPFEPPTQTPEPPTAPRCGHEIFCGPDHPECCDIHPLGSLGEMIGIRAMYPTMTMRRRARLSGLGRVVKQRPKLTMRDDPTAEPEPTLPVTVSDINQLTALLKAIVAATQKSPLNQDPNFVNTSKFSHNDVVAADQFGKTIAGLAIANKDLLQKLSGLAQQQAGTPSAMSNAIKNVFKEVPSISTTVNQLMSDVVAAFLQTPSSGASGGGSVSNINIDEANTSYADETYYLKMAELQKATDTGIGALLKNEKLDTALGTAKFLTEAAANNPFSPNPKLLEKQEYKVLKALFDGIDAAQKLLKKPKKQSSARLPYPSLNPALQNPYGAATAGGINKTPALVQAGLFPAGFTPSVAPQLAPVGSGVVQTPIIYGPPDLPPVVPTAPPAAQPIDPGTFAGFGELFGA